MQLTACVHNISGLEHLVRAMLLIGWRYYRKITGLIQTDLQETLCTIQSHLPFAGNRLVCLHPLNEQVQTLTVSYFGKMNCAYRHTAAFFQSVYSSWKFRFCPYSFSLSSFCSRITQKLYNIYTSDLHTKWLLYYQRYSFSWFELYAS